MNVCIARQSVRAHGLFPLFLPSPAFIPFSALFPYNPSDTVVALPLSTFASPSAFLSPRRRLVVLSLSPMFSPLSPFLSLLVYQRSILFLILSPSVFLRLSFARHVLPWIIVASSFLSFRFAFPSFFPRHFLVLLLLRLSCIQRVYCTRISAG